MIRLRTSTLWEFLISMDAAAHSWQFEAWTEKVGQTLGESFLTGGKREIPSYNKGFYELAIDAPDNGDIEAFFQYIRSMSVEDFIFYSLGRVVSKKNIHLPLNLERLKNRVEQYCRENDCSSPLLENSAWFSDPESKKNELLSNWENYYRNFYKANTQDFSKEYQKKIREWTQILEAEGGRALYQHIVTNDWFPNQIPAGQEYTSIEVIPIHYLSQRQRMYFGYGRIVILVSSLHTPELMQSIEELKNDLVILLKALGDDSRLEILRLIVESEYDMNGKSLAKRLSISPSVVSRHLKQLKNAGIIMEKTADNRNFTYGINRDSVLQINRKLLYYLTEKKD